MKALTLWQPWATLVAEKLKPCEFRRWKCPASIQGTRIAIHAGARKFRLPEIDDLIDAIRRRDGWGTALDPEPALEALLKMRAAPEKIVLSHVLCTAEIGEPVPAAEAVRAVYGAKFVGDSDRIDEQVYGWPMRDVKPLIPPVPAKGAQGFWTWTSDRARV